MELGTHVESILVEQGRAAGVRLRNGNTITATKAVISNAAIWDTLKLLPPGAVPNDWAASMAATPQCESFMHLHLGIDATGLPDDLEIHHIVVDDWDLGTLTLSRVGQG
jgi:phytoene dehydrogenase-like protein